MSRAQVESAILQLFEALNSDDVSDLPLAENIKFFAMLTSESISGEPAVRDHLQQLAPFMLNVENRQMVIDDDSGAVLTKFEGVNGVHIDGAYFLKLEEGKISEIRPVFDTRPLFSGSKG